MPDDKRAGGREGGVAAVDPIGAVLAVLKDSAAIPAYGGGVPVAFIRAEAFERFRISYDRVNRILAELVESEVVVKPRRGYYLSERVRFAGVAHVGDDHE